MSILKKTITSGLVLATLAGALAATAPAAEARDYYRAQRASGDAPTPEKKPAKKR